MRINVLFKKRLNIIVQHYSVDEVEVFSPVFGPEFHMYNQSEKSPLISFSKFN